MGSSKVPKEYWCSCKRMRLMIKEIFRRKCIVCGSKMVTNSGVYGCTQDGVKKTCARCNKYNKCLIPFINQYPATGGICRQCKDARGYD